MRPHVLIASLVCGLLAHAAVAAAQNVSVVAVTGKKGPGPARRIETLALPYVGPHGEIAFAGGIRGDPGWSLFLRRNKKLRVAARAGRRAAGMPRGIVYWGPSPIGFDDFGRLYFSGNAGPKDPLADGFGFALWRTKARGKGVELLLREGQEIPGIGVLGSPNDLTVGPAGHVVYRYADLRILIRSPEGALSVAVWDTTPPSGMPDGFVFLSVGRMLLDAGGTLIFEGFVYDAENEVGGLGIWRRRVSGELEAVVLPGSNPPGGAGRALAGASLQRGGSSGTIAALGGFADAIEPYDLACALEAAPDATAAVTVPSGITPPGVPSEYVIGGFRRGWVDDAGHAFYEIDVVLTNGADTLPGSTGVWRSENGTLTPLAIPGSVVAGDPLRTMDETGFLHFGRSGAMAFRSTTLGDGVPDHLSSLLAVPSAGGPPRVLFTEGDRIRVAPKQWVQAGFDLPTTDPFSTFLTPVDADRVAFRAGLYDGRQAIVLVDIPAP